MTTQPGQPTEAEIEAVTNQLHDYMAPHTGGTIYNENDLCDQCVPLAKFFLAAVLPAHDARIRAETLREAADEVITGGGGTIEDVAARILARADAEAGE